MIELETKKEIFIGMVIIGIIFCIFLLFSIAFYEFSIAMYIPDLKLQSGYIFFYTKPILGTLVLFSISTILTFSTLYFFEWITYKIFKKHYNINEGD